MHRLWALLALLAVGHAQKSVEAPQPGLVEIPSPQFVIPAAPVATVLETIHSVAPVPGSIVNVPHRQEVIDIPNSPLQLPAGGVQETTAEYDIPQPIVSVPAPVIQEKPVVFNVPQDIVQVPRPVIRHRPILYKVPHIIRLRKPIIRNNQVLYDISPARVTKSGYQPGPVPGIHVLPAPVHRGGCLLNRS